MRFKSLKFSLKLTVVAATVSILWFLLAGVALAAGSSQSGSNPDSNLRFLFGVYTVTWLAFFAYAFYMTRRQQELRREVRDLWRAVEERKEQ
jgi:CcmD family protein